MKFSTLLTTLAAAAVSTQANIADESNGQVFHVTTPKVIWDATYAEFPLMDVWEVRASDDGQTVEVDFRASPEEFGAIAMSLKGPQVNTELGAMTSILPDTIDTVQELKEHRKSLVACKERTTNFLNEVDVNAKYVDNAFFDCYRTTTEIYAFFDKLVSENPNLFSKIENVSKTVEGKSIHAYKISTGAGRSSIFSEGLLHAREWHGGTSTHYSMAGLLDALKSKDSQVTGIFEKYDWYWIPVVNVDGYDYSWNGNRYWRKNRRGGYGVDLNRNYGPESHFDRRTTNKNSQTYPGPDPLSEPETKGIFSWLKTLPNLSGALDLHSYSALVLRPFGNQDGEAPAPYGPKLKKLGDAVNSAIERGHNTRYTSQTAADLYLAYGTFQDSMYMEMGKIPALTFEMEGNSFVQPESVIRVCGQHIYQGVVQFGLEVDMYKPAPGPSPTSTTYQPTPTSTTYPPTPTPTSTTYQPTPSPTGQCSSCNRCFVWGMCLSMPKSTCSFLKGKWCGSME